MRISEPMRRALLNMLDGKRGDHGLYGMSAAGGYTNTYFALLRRGLVDDNGMAGGLTDKGREAAMKLRKVPRR